MKFVFVLIIICSCTPKVVTVNNRPVKQETHLELQHDSDNLIVVRDVFSWRLSNKSKSLVSSKKRSLNKLKLKINVEDETKPEIQIELINSFNKRHPLSFIIERDLIPDVRSFKLQDSLNFLSFNELDQIFFFATMKPGTTVKRAFTVEKFYFTNSENTLITENQGGALNSESMNLILDMNPSFIKIDSVIVKDADQNKYAIETNYKCSIFFDTEYSMSHCIANRSFIYFPAIIDTVPSGRKINLTKSRKCNLFKFSPNSLGSSIVVNIYDQNDFLLYSESNYLGQSSENPYFEFSEYNFLKIIYSGDFSWEGNIYLNE